MMNHVQRVDEPCAARHETRTHEAVPEMPEREEIERIAERARRLQAWYAAAMVKELGGRLADRVRRALESHRERRQDAEATRELEALDARMLRDIGVWHRSQIPSFVREARERRREESEGRASRDGTVTRTTHARREGKLAAVDCDKAA